MVKRQKGTKHCFKLLENRVGPGGGFHYLLCSFASMALCVIINTKQLRNSKEKWRENYAM